VNVEAAIRRRRTIKELVPVPVERATVEALLELAVHAPNHHRTEPWRFVVLGGETVDALAAATGDPKLRRSRTAIVVGQRVDPDPVVAREDYAACACAIATLMLAARGRGLASYCRTPKALGHPSARPLLGLSDDVEPVGIVHLGEPVAPFPPPIGRSAAARTRWLP
jgi:nitroreductase